MDEKIELDDVCLIMDCDLDDKKLISFNSYHRLEIFLEEEIHKSKIKEVVSNIESINKLDRLEIYEYHQSRFAIPSYEYVYKCYSRNSSTIITINKESGYNKYGSLIIETSAYASIYDLTTLNNLSQAINLKVKCLNPITFIDVEKSILKEFNITEIQLGLLYRETNKKFRKSKYLINEYDRPKNLNIETFGLDSFRYNIIIPYLTGIMENFFKQFAIKFIDSKEVSYINNLKLCEEDINKYDRTDKSYGDIIQKYTNFHNLNKTIEFYSTYLNINLTNLFNDTVKNKYKKILSLRNKIVHESFDPINTSKEEIIENIDFMQNIVDSLAITMQQEFALKINFDEYLHKKLQEYAESENLLINYV